MKIEERYLGAAQTSSQFFILAPIKGLCVPLAWWTVLSAKFPELNEPARPTAARPVSRDTGGPAPGERGADRATG